jgi:hypothetical protein
MQRWWRTSRTPAPIAPAKTGLLRPGCWRRRWPPHNTATPTPTALPPDQAEAVLLRTVLGLDATHAATILGKRPGAIRTATHRGLRTLARHLDQTGHRLGDAPAGVTQPENLALRDMR